MIGHIACQMNFVRWYFEDILANNSTWMYVGLTVWIRVLQLTRKKTELLGKHGQHLNWPNEVLSTMQT